MNIQNVIEGVNNKYMVLAKEKSEHESAED